VDEARAVYLVSDPFPDTEDFDKEAELGRIMLEGYLQWIEDEGIDANLEVLGVEETLVYPMLDGKVELVGKIDLRVRNRITGMRSTLDFKSAASLGDFDKTGHMQTQLKTYQLLDMLTSPEDKRIEGGIYRIMKKVKRTAKANPPFFAEFPVRHNRTTIENYWKQVNGILREILAVRRGLTEKGGDHQVLAYPSPTRDCSWKCDFYTICPMFDDGSAVESAIADMYVEVDPYAYYSDDAETGS
jgi:hypothetical protein